VAQPAASTADLVVIQELIQLDQEAADYMAAAAQTMILASI
jgi:hypothetical protein